MNAPLVLCCGEAVLDLIPARLHDGDRGFRAVPGGAAVNTAVALARLGVSSGFVGALSTDPMGERLGNHLRGEGVDTRFAAEIDAPSTVAFAHPIADGTRFDLLDEGSAGRKLGHAPGLPDDTGALIFGGLSLIHAPAADVFADLAESASGPLIWLDLNIRPGLISDETGYRARLARMIAAAHVVKVSDEDLDWFGPLPVLRPDQTLIHTHGADGATVRTARHEITATAPQARISDTVGAGDIFTAGFLAYLARRDRLRPPLDLERNDLSGALRAGIRAASLSVSRPGADAPRLEEMKCVL